ncbi:MAG: ABC transporter permease [Ramlibacter sp.]|jgi:NitT/TauT family transport system permease protein|uniref:ABC transporter permease n=1 Tax=Ramlibacter sp. TaxID=1917967 RepID=UPI00260A5049|nr:ABC transporter permease [Ramlibacter sp.]MDH4377728.1 ABC transporter permease [Ramlibacter sp.]
MRSGDEAAVMSGGRSIAIAQYEAAQGRRARLIILMRILVGIAFFALWEYSSGRFIDKLFISSPSGVFARLGKWILDGTLWNHLSITLYATLWGFAIGSVVGFSLGLLFGRFKALAEVLDPYITALYSIPKIALAPLFIIWFGIGIESKIAVSASIVFFVVFLNTYAGVRDVNPLYIHAIRIMGGSQWHVLRSVIMPSATSWVITGLKVSVPYALVGTVIGEFMSSNRGIGFIISQATGLFDTTSVFSGLIILAIVGAIFNEGLGRLEAWLLRWR